LARLFSFLPKFKRLVSRPPPPPRPQRITAVRPSGTAQATDPRPSGMKVLFGSCSTTKEQDPKLSDQSRALTLARHMQEDYPEADEALRTNERGKTDPGPNPKTSCPSPYSALRRRPGRTEILFEIGRQGWGWPFGRSERTLRACFYNTPKKRICLGTIKSI